MQRTHLHNISHSQHSHTWIPSRIRLLETVLLLIALYALVTFVIPTSFRAFNSFALLLGPGQSREQMSESADSAESLAIFEQNARRLVRSGSPEAFQALVQTLKQDEPESHRAITIALLKDASPEVVPVLLKALEDSDAGVRAGVARVLGMRRESQAVSPLTAATRDSKAQVRKEAVQSLGVLYAWQALPQLEQVRVNEGNLDVRQAADSAVAKIKAEIAKEIGVSDYKVVDTAVTTSDSPQLYAVTESALYALHGRTWKRVSQLPDTPIGLATGSDKNLLNLATVNFGLYHSLDGGKTWQHVQFGLQTPTQLTVTSIVVDPQNPQQLYAALAALGADPAGLDPLGIFSSSDAGNTWKWLPKSPRAPVTSRLILDQTTRKYLYGLSDVGPWRYELSE